MIFSFWHPQQTTSISAPRGHQPCEHVNPPRSAWWRSLRPRPRGRLSCDKMALLESQIGRRVQMRHSKRRCDWGDARVVAMIFWTIEWCLTSLLCWTFLPWLDKRHISWHIHSEEALNALFGSNLPYSGCNHHHQDDITLSVENPQPKPVAWYGPARPTLVHNGKIVESLFHCLGPLLTLKVHCCSVWAGHESHSFIGKKWPAYEWSLV